MVRKEIQRYNSIKGTKGNAGFIQTVDFDQNDGKNNIPMPTIVTSGAQKIEEVKTIADFTKTMASQMDPRSSDNKWYYSYSPEAVLTQAGEQNGI